MVTVTSPTEAHVGRSRRDVLGRFGAALFGASAATLIKSRVASATHVPPPTGCYGYGVCHCCPSCGAVQPQLGCPTGTGCWAYTDPGQCRTYRCCDYLYNGTPCLCRTVMCNCC
jgi:hypothetical protein